MNHKIKTLFTLLLFIIERVQNDSNVKLRTVEEADHVRESVANVLATIDTAAGDETLENNVTALLLKELCVCMGNALNKKELKVAIENKNLPPDKNYSDREDLDLYRKIYNRMCNKLQQELSNLVLDKCKYNNNLTYCNRNHVEAILEKNVRIRFEKLMFDIFIKNEKRHRYTIKKYNIYQIPQKFDKDVMRPIIILITLNSRNGTKKFSTSTSISLNELNDFVESDGIVDVDFIDAMYESKNSKIGSQKNVSPCNLRSVYAILVGSVFSNLTKSFKLLREKDTVKLYTSLLTNRTHDEYFDVCCNKNRNKFCEIPSNDNLNNLTRFEEEFVSKNRFEILLKYRDTLAKIKNLIQLYKKKIEFKKEGPQSTTTNNISYNKRNNIDANSKKSFNDILYDTNETFGNEIYQNFKETLIYTPNYTKNKIQTLINLGSHNSLTEQKTGLNIKYKSATIQNKSNYTANNIVKTKANNPKTENLIRVDLNSDKKRVTVENVSGNMGIKDLFFKVTPRHVSSTNRVIITYINTKAADVLLSKAYSWPQEEIETSLITKTNRINDSTEKTKNQYITNYFDINKSTNSSDNENYKDYTTSSNHIYRNTHFFNNNTGLHRSSASRTNNDVGKSRVIANTRNPISRETKSLNFNKKKFNTTQKKITKKATKEINLQLKKFARRNIKRKYSSKLYATESTIKMATKLRHDVKETLSLPVTNESPLPTFLHTTKDIDHIFSLISYNSREKKIVETKDVVTKVEKKLSNYIDNGTKFGNHLETQSLLSDYILIKNVTPFTKRNEINNTTKAADVNHKMLIKTNSIDETSIDRKYKSKFASLYYNNTETYLNESSSGTVTLNFTTAINQNNYYNTINNNLHREKNANVFKLENENVLQIAKDLTITESMFQRNLNTKSEANKHVINNISSTHKSNIGEKFSDLAYWTISPLAANITKHSTSILLDKNQEVQQAIKMLPDDVYINKSTQNYVTTTKLNRGRNILASQVKSTESLKATLAVSVSSWIDDYHTTLETKGPDTLHELKTLNRTILPTNSFNQPYRARNNSKEVFDLLQKPNQTLISRTSTYKSIGSKLCSSYYQSKSKIKLIQATKSLKLTADARHLISNVEKSTLKLDNEGYSSNNSIIAPSSGRDNYVAQFPITRMYSKHFDMPYETLRKEFTTEKIFAQVLQPTIINRYKIDSTLRSSLHDKDALGMTTLRQKNMSSFGYTNELLKKYWTKSPKYNVTAPRTHETMIKYEKFFIAQLGNHPVTLNYNESNNNRSSRKDYTSSRQYHYKKIIKLYFNKMQNKSTEAPHENNAITLYLRNVVSSSNTVPTTHEMDNHSITTPFTNKPTSITYYFENKTSSTNLKIELKSSLNKKKSSFVFPTLELAPLQILASTTPLESDDYTLQVISASHLNKNSGRNSKKKYNVYDDTISNMKSLQTVTNVDLPNLRKIIGHNETYHPINKIYTITAQMKHKSVVAPVFHMLLNNTKKFPNVNITSFSTSGTTINMNKRRKILLNNFSVDEKTSDMMNFTDKTKLNNKLTGHQGKVKFLSKYPIKVVKSNIHKNIFGNGMTTASNVLSITTKYSKAQGNKNSEIHYDAPEPETSQTNEPIVKSRANATTSATKEFFFSRKRLHVTETILVFKHENTNKNYSFQRLTNTNVCSLPIESNVTNDKNFNNDKSYDNLRDITSQNIVVHGTKDLNNSTLSLKNENSTPSSNGLPSNNTRTVNTPHTDSKSTKNTTTDADNTYEYVSDFCITRDMKNPKEHQKEFQNLHISTTRYLDKKTHSVKTPKSIGDDNKSDMNSKPLCCGRILITAGIIFLFNLEPCGNHNVTKNVRHVGFPLVILTNTNNITAERPDFNSIFKSPLKSVARRINEGYKHFRKHIVTRNNVTSYQVVAAHNETASRNKDEEFLNTVPGGKDVPLLVLTAADGQYIFEINRNKTRLTLENRSRKHLLESYNRLLKVMNTFSQSSDHLSNFHSNNPLTSVIKKIKQFDRSELSKNINNQQPARVEVIIPQKIDTILEDKFNQRTTKNHSRSKNTRHFESEFQSNASLQLFKNRYLFIEKMYPNILQSELKSTLLENENNTNKYLNTSHHHNYFLLSTKTTPTAVPAPTRKNKIIKYNLYQPAPEDPDDSLDTQLQLALELKWKHNQTVTNKNINLYKTYNHIPSEFYKIFKLDKKNDAKNTKNDRMNSSKATQTGKMTTEIKILPCSSPPTARIYEQHPSEEQLKLLHGDRILNKESIVQREKNVLTVNTDDFYSQRRFYSKKMLRDVPKSRHVPFVLHEPATARPRRVILRPVFRSRADGGPEPQQEREPQREREPERQRERPHSARSSWQDKIVSLQKMLLLARLNPNVMEKPSLPTTEYSVFSDVYNPGHGEQQKTAKIKKYYLKYRNRPRSGQIDKPLQVYKRKLLHNSTLTVTPSKRSRRTIFFLSPTVPYNRYF